MNDFFISPTTIGHFLKEDGVFEKTAYAQNLPQKKVQLHLKAKSSLLLAGLPWVESVFNFLAGKDLNLSLSEKEGQFFSNESNTIAIFELPFSVAILGERVALNLLQRASSIATFTNEFVKKAQKYQVKILDTRKTLPGYRELDKYAVRMGGGFNHRFNQSDVWMIKDNHKIFFGGIKPSLDFFKSLQSFYTPIMAEVHSLDELQEALELGIAHLLLDHFTLQDLKKAGELKKSGVTYELSGGVNLENLEHFLQSGVLDAVSIGILTTGAPAVDISLKVV